MKAEKIAKLIIAKIGMEVWSSNRRCPGLVLQARGDWDTGCDEAAAEIAKQVVSRDEYEAETAILGNRVFKAEAKLAVMAEIVKVVAAEGQPLPDVLKDEYIVLQEITAGMVRQARKALSAAPKVEWVGEAFVAHYHSQGTGEPYTALEIDVSSGSLFEEFSTVPIIVLAEEEK